MRALIILVILTLLIKSICTDEVSEFKKRIYRKSLHHVADENEWKFITVITVGRFVLCTGVLIRPFWVLSAANCFKKNDTVLPQKFGLLSVRVGSKQVTYLDWNLVAIQPLNHKQIVPTVLEDDLISIVKFLIHPEYYAHDSSQVNRFDIGIGKLLNEGGNILAPMPTQPTGVNLTCRAVTYKSMVTHEEDAKELEIGALREFTGSPFDTDRCKTILKLLGNSTHPVPKSHLSGKFCISFGNVTKLEELRDFGMVGAPVACEGLQGISCVLTVQTIKAETTYHQYVEVFTDFLTHLDWIQKSLKKYGDEGLNLGQNLSLESERASGGVYFFPSFYLLLALLIIISTILV